MQLKISTKGRVVLPPSILRILGIRAGETLDVKVECGQIVLVPHKKRPYRMKIVSDPITGFPVASAGPKAPILTSKEVEDMLADFP